MKSRFGGISLKRMGRRGQTEEIVEHIPYIILTVIVLAGIYALLSPASNPKIDTGLVQAEVFMYRTLYSPGSISFSDPITGSSYPGIIDEARFNATVLDNSTFYSYERQVSARLTIYLADEQYRDKPHKVAYYNGKWFERLEPLADAGVKGQSGARKYTRTMPVVFRQGGADLDAFLKFEVIIPN